MSLSVSNNSPANGRYNLRFIEDQDRRAKGPRRETPKPATPVEEPFDPTAEIIIDDKPKVHGPELSDAGADIAQALDNLARLAIEDSAARVDAYRFEASYEAEEPEILYGEFGPYWYEDIEPEVVSYVDVRVADADQLFSANDDIDWDTPQLTAFYAEDVAEDPKADPEPEREPIIVELEPYPARPLNPRKINPYLHRSLYRKTAALDRDN